MPKVSVPSAGLVVGGSVLLQRSGASWGGSEKDPAGD